MSEPGLLPQPTTATAPSADPRYQRLAEYWAHGKGAAKIRWGIPGDFDRCVRQLTEEAGAEMTPGQIKGLCNHLHQRALGVPPGQEHPKAAAGATVTLPGVDIVAAGTWQLSSGETTFTAEMLRSAIDASQCPAVGAPLIKLGHVDPRFDGEPAVGQVRNLVLAAGDAMLKGDLAGLPAWLAESMPTAYPRRSIEGAFDFRCQIGHVHPFVITGLALLGVTAPGVGVLNGIEDVRALYEGVAAKGTPAMTWTLDLGGPRMNDPKAARGRAVTAEDIRTAYYETQGAQNYALWITEVTEGLDALIVADSAGRKTYRVPVSTEAGAVTFGEPVEVVPAYVEASALPALPAGALPDYMTRMAIASWDAGAAVRAMGDTPSASAIRAMFAVPADSKSDSKLPHHNCSGGKVGAANPDACSAAIAAINGARGGMTGVSASAARSAYNHLAAHLRDAGREPPPFGGASAAAGTPPVHDPFTGKHAHPHPALGAQGGDEMHEHEHAHSGDADHAHDHAARASTEGATEVDFTQEIEAGLRSQLGIEPEGDFTPEALLSAVTELRKTADGKAHASYKPPEGVIVVAKEAWDGLQARVRQGELAREAQLRGERDQVLAEAIRAGKFSASQRQRWERLWTADPEGTRAAIGTLQRNAVPVEDIGRPGGSPDDLLDDEYRALFPQPQQ